MATEVKDTPTVSKDFDLFGGEFESPNVEASAVPTEEADKGEVTPVVEAGSQGNAAESKVRREIDLGDGSGKQVFEADTAEELLDKLTTAQTHATRKIREQAFALKQAQRAKPEREAPATPKLGDTKQLSTDELFQIGQELQKNPASAFDKILQAATGLSAAQLKQIGTDWASNQQNLQVQGAETAFLQAHEGVDYLPTKENANAIIKFLQDEKLPYTTANLEYAFQELSEGGLLDMPNSDVQEQEPGDKGGQQEERIVVPAHTRRRPMTTGLRNDNGTTRPAQEKPTATGLTELETEQLYKLPLEEARAFMLKKMAAASAK